MTLADARNMDRFAQPLLVDIKTKPTGSWYFCSNAKVERIEINVGSKSSVARFWEPAAQWQQSFRARYLRGNLVRIRTSEPDPTLRSVIFQGFISAHSLSFSGGMGSGEGFSAGHERFAVVCRDYRWLLGVTSPVIGQYCRGPDDYTNYGLMTEAPIENSCVFLLGRRTIFNENGRPNKDLTNYILTAYDDASIPIFAPPDRSDYTKTRSEYWTARNMLLYVLSPLYNKSHDYLPISDPGVLTGLNDSDFDKVLHHVVVDGLNAVEAIELICRHVGWSFREQYSNEASDNVTFAFYKPGSASGYSRSSSRPVILHSLHAPAVGESISTAVAAGKKMLWSMALNRDLTEVVNKPYGLGAPHRFEFTAELVPAWFDNELIPDTSASLANLFFADADLQDISAPNSKSYYRNYHTRGSGFASGFKRNVARQWCLNENARYSGVFNRGAPFDFASVIDPSYIFDSTGKRLYGPFNRQLLPALTQDKMSQNSVGIKVEFSFNGGSSWQVLPCAISSLPDECGIYISEPNLAEMVDQSESTISGGILDGVQLNYWTSLCDDWLNSRSFKDGQWRTRVRVTASVQLDRRLAKYSAHPSLYGSPFEQVRVFDFTNKYGLEKRMPSSVYAGGDMSADEVDSTSVIDEHLEAIRQRYQDASISGIFVLERLWLGDGSGGPDFYIGDGIEKITGRSYLLAADSDAGRVYPEIVQLIYLPEEQKTQLITRDLRFAEVTL